MEENPMALICKCQIAHLSQIDEKTLAKSIQAYTELIASLEAGYQMTFNENLCSSCHKLPWQINSREEFLSLIYNERGQLRYLIVNFDGAIRDYTKAIELMPNAVSFYNRGQVYYRLGFFKEAVKDFKEALNQQNDFENAKLGLEACKKALQNI